MPETDLIADLKQRLESWKPSSFDRTVGTVERVADGAVLISGLPEAAAGELLRVETPQGPVPCLALNLDEGSIGGVLVGNPDAVRAGQTVIGTGAAAVIRVSEGILGRTVDPLGLPLDGGPELDGGSLMPLERRAPGVMQRRSVHQPLQTGITAIDAMIPIGKGQRELIIGDRGTGKTAVAVEAILNQRGTGTVCIYVAIGQKEAKIARLRAELEEAGAMQYTVLVVAGASDPATLQYLAPYAGCAIGEYFMDAGRDALVVYDDLSKHAAAYREISLLLRRPPGREAYPGDVFYLHSRLLERAAKLSDAEGAGSLTALPIIETQAGDVSAYIPTNVISITDGQIYLESDLFYQGVRPALNVGISVSRVGGAAQTKIMKKVAGRLRLELAQYRELAAFSQFGSDLDDATKARIERGKRLSELLKQPQYAPRSVAAHVALIHAGTSGALDAISVERTAEFARKVPAELRLETGLEESLAGAAALEGELLARLDAFIARLTA